AELEVKPDKEVVVKGTKAGFRRGIYVLQRRQTPVTLLEAFDQPPMTPNCLERRQSNVATQALQMMNGSAVWDHSRYMAGRIIDAVGDQPGQQIEQVYLRTLSRQPSAAESAQAASALETFAAQWPERLAEDNSDAPKAWTARWMALAGLCHTMLNSAEFVFID
ncbi:MAG: DUF1553 domain-containing protein, partial [Bryobacteraceae bacterium]